MFYEWQEKAVERIAGKNAILSAPTGSGKTWVAYRWAGLMDAGGSPAMPDNRVIFTAPIKALSNERYLDLRKMGFDVGLETGDFKKNPGAEVLCCTQEIYTLKYAHLPGQRVIVDEFHFIFASPERTRAYIDGIRATAPDSMLLVMSATFGDPQTVRDYLEDMGRRDFELFETKERVTKLVFRKKGVHYSRIRDALVFVFSRKGADYVAKQIARVRKKIERSDRARLREMAEILEVNRTPETMLSGVGVYYGSLFPKEKLLVEMAFRERILDVVVGTDALSLGVNLPAESVVFAQMAKYVDGPLTHNEFLQMSGRAGRKGYFETGYVSFIPRSKAEHHDFDTETLYREVLASPSEPARIEIQPAVGRLLKQRVTKEQEARMIADCSLPRTSYGQALAEVEELLLLINRTLGLVRNPKERGKLRDALADLWFDEMSVTGNFAVARLFVTDGEPDAMKAAEILGQEERNYLQALLKVKRYANRMPDGYRFSNMERIDATVERIDATVFGFEEKIRQLDLTEDSWLF
ncbi:MAG: DEAD/DEAH box helicase [Synergistaceae bacterium]|jgi:superfamily II RNA helicase|nr:DEAD/DEAH box helicase [Synergistaceae bacterium]